MPGKILRYLVPFNYDGIAANRNSAGDLPRTFGDWLCGAGGSVKSKYCDPELDELIKKYMRVSDEPTLQRIARDIQIHFAQQLYFIPAPIWRVHAAGQPWVRDWKFDGKQLYLDAIMERGWFDR